MSNLSVASNASVNVFHASAFGMPICKSLDSVEITLKVPYLCDGVSYGDRSWRGGVCFPFWEYQPFPVLLFFMVLIWILRPYAMNKRDKWQDAFNLFKKKKKGEEEDSEDDERSPGRKFHKNKTPLLEGETSNKTMYQEGFAKSQFKDRVGEWLHRVVLQVAQWWALMVLLLVYLMIIELQRLDDKFEFGQYIWYPLLTQQPMTKPPAFDRMPDWMAWFSINSLIALFLIYIIVLVCILGQVVMQLLGAFHTNPLRCLACADGSVLMFTARDVAIQVLLLPMVYGFLAARSVINMWCCICETFPDPLSCTHWDASLNKEVPPTTRYSKKLMMASYQSNFALADMYEAWALYCFAQMLTKILEPELMKKIQIKVIWAFEGLLTIDVLVFVFVELLSALYSILLTWVQWRFGVNVCEVVPPLCILSPYLVGADWTCSSIAIYNLLVIEIRFHDLDSMKKFGPRLKFFAIKVMVLVSFWSALVLPIVQASLDVDNDQVHLLDASFRIYTMFFVSILNIAAWWPVKQWFGIVRDAGATVRQLAVAHGQSQPLTDVGVKDRPTSGILNLMSELLPKDVDVEEFADVKLFIKDLKENELDLLMFKGSQIGWIIESDTAVARRQKVPKWRLLGPKDSDDRSEKVLLRNCTLEEKQIALLNHLAGFYPADNEP